MNKEILEKYANLKLEAKKIDAQLEFLQPAVLKEVMAISVDQPVELKGVGTYSITKKKKWNNFSMELMDLKTKVTDQEAKEKAEGPATFEEVEILVFKELKNG